jgi:hypothetical protein
MIWGRRTIVRACLQGTPKSCGRNPSFTELSRQGGARLLETRFCSVKNDSGQQRGRCAATLIFRTQTDYCCVLNPEGRTILAEKPLPPGHQQQQGAASTTGFAARNTATTCSSGRPDTTV